MPPRFFRLPRRELFFSAWAMNDKETNETQPDTAEPPSEAAEDSAVEAPAESAGSCGAAEVLDDLENVPAGEDGTPEADGEAVPEAAGEAGEGAVEQDPVELDLLASVLEAVLFTSQKPVTVQEFQNFLKGAANANPENPGAVALGKLRAALIVRALERLRASIESAGRSFELSESAAGYQLVTRSNFAPWLRQMFPENRQAKLSTPALETLAIIAYRQPITRADIEAVRGVAVDGVMQTLVDRGLVKIAGRAEIPGRPLLYETTQHFMEHFGIRDIAELPNAGELRAMPLPKAPVPEPKTKKPDDAAVDAPVETSVTDSEAPAEQTEGEHGSEKDAEAAGVSELESMEEEEGGGAVDEAAASGVASAFSESNEFQDESRRTDP